MEVSEGGITRERCLISLFPGTRLKPCSERIVKMNTETAGGSERRADGRETRKETLKKKEKQSELDIFLMLFLTKQALGSYCQISIYADDSLLLIPTLKMLS